jgi:hypothetical protein
MGSRMTCPKTASFAGVASLFLLAATARAQPAETSTITETSTAPTAPRIESAAQVVPPNAVRLHPDDPRADHSGTPPKPPKDPMLGPPSAEPGQERPLPDYDNRPPERTTAGDVLIWVPRVAFSPVYLTLEYLLRRPVIATVAWSEKNKVFARIGQIFTFRDGKSGFFPTAFLDFGLSPSVGFFTYHDDVGYEGHRITLQGGIWVDNWKRLAAADTWSIFGGDGTLTFKGEFITRPDDPFYGVGYKTDIDDRTNIRFRRLDGEIALSSYVKDLNKVGISARFRDGKLSDGQDPEFSELNKPVGRFTGFDADGYQLVSVNVQGTADTRANKKEFTSGSGARLELLGGYHFSPGSSDLSFLRFGGEASAFYDFSGRNHVLGLSVYTEVIEKVGKTPLPVTELILLGGAEYLRGFLPGRFRGESAFVATLDYRWPVWILMDADLFAGVGNVFGPNFDDFGWKRLTFNTGFALRLGLSRDTTIDALIAVGTSRFDAASFEVDNVRITIGANHGF